MENEAALLRYENSNTSVWWDITRCPVPPGYNASLVGPCIERALKNLGYSGPLTITAIGNLKGIPDDVLRAISSTGILLKHVPNDLTSIVTHMMIWKTSNQPPATIMFISNSSGVERLSRQLCSIQKKGYDIVLAYPGTQPKPKSDLVASAECLWETLLAVGSDKKQPATLQLVKCTSTDLPPNCTNSGQSASFSCTLCFSSGTLCFSSFQSFEDFTTHLNGEEHARKELMRDAYDLKNASPTTTMVNKQPKRLMERHETGGSTTMLSKRKKHDLNILTSGDVETLQKQKKLQEKKKKKMKKKQSEGEVETGSCSYRPGHWNKLIKRKLENDEVKAGDETFHQENAVKTQSKGKKQRTK